MDDLMRVKIEDIDHKGNGIAKMDNKIIFVPKCISGDYVDIDIVRSHKKYDDARIVRIVSNSDNRIDSLCPYYQLCGGCNISNLNYTKQLEYKKMKVINIFKRYLDMDINPEIIGSDIQYGYRNKITYKCLDGKLGLVSIDNDLVDIDKCMLVNKKINELYNVICNEDLSQVNKIIIKECDNGLILCVNGNMKINNIKSFCLSIYMDDECVFKREDGYINIGKIKYRVSMDSFFQINTSNIVNLYDIILKYGDFNKDDIVIDLYCGVGSISLYISEYVKSVLGIEIIKNAIKDANENANLNNIKNVEFICGDVSKLVDEKVKGNKIIVDPPRGGLDKHTIDTLNIVDVDKLIYVSCDPMTLVRDLGMLRNYVIRDITLVDMFPQTHHVESVVLLCKKEC